MRNRIDRLRHAIFFEIMGVCFSAPLVSEGFQISLKKIGIMSIVMSLLAMVWNMVYNNLFDHLLMNLGYPLDNRSVFIRIGHAVLFELGITVFSIPIIVWWLSIPLVQALFIDFSLVSFYLFYGLLYNWLYDRIFPYPNMKTFLKI
ncbi:MAG: PACE efflux transporter [Deltaproteobacteria bacterium]|nr:PACE efflux transporter [Deltaproteobacteria bacterium]